MSKDEKRIIDNMKEMTSNPIVSPSILDPDMIQYEADRLQNSEHELLGILNLSSTFDIIVETITFDQLTKLTFDHAHNVINKMSIKKRIQILVQFQKHLDCLYDATKGYTDQMFGKSMPAKTFRSILGKIKHLEILQAWLYGIE
jgi:hypothetical protein